jgi:nucleoside-diphosphate-sugar epimerase
MKVTIKKVFITGANGFIGRQLEKKLNETGVETCGIDFQADADRNVIAADLMAVEKWEAMLNECDAVVHTAAVVSNALSADDTWNVNVLGTQVVLDAAANSKKTKRFLHLSSVAAMGFEHTTTMNENLPLKACGQPYRDTKIASEHVVLNYHTMGKIDTCIVRPADVYGPGSKPWVVFPIAELKKKSFVVPKEGMFGPVYIDDLINGVYLALTKPESSGQIFIISGFGEVTNSEYFGRLAEMIGIKKVPTLPSKLVIMATAAYEKGFHLLGKTTDINPLTMKMLSRPNADYSHAKATEILGYKPEVNLDEGMRRSEEWLRNEGMI